MPARMPESSPLPVSSRTLPLRIFAPGATPLYLPPDLAPVPAAMDATWVPWPKWSVASAAVEKFLDSITWVLRSGWLASTPVSRTAILTPFPWYPAAHAVGAPMSGTDVSRLALRTPSSQTCAMPEAVPVVGDRGPQLGRVPLRRLHRVRVQGLEAPAERAGVADLGLGGRRGSPVADDHLQAPLLGLADRRLVELGDIEEPPVELAAGYQRLGVGRHHQRVAVGLADLHGHVLAALGPLRSRRRAPWRRRPRGHR